MNELSTRETEYLEPNVVERRKRNMRDAFHLSLRGHSIKAISRILGVTPATTRSYLKEQKESLRDTQQTINQDLYLTEIRSDFEQMRYAAWADYDNARKPGDRAKFLKLIAELRIRETKILQECEVLEKAAIRVDHQHSGTVGHIHGQVHLNADLSEENLEAVMASLLSAQMGVTPEQLLVMRGRPTKFIEAGEPVNMGMKVEKKEAPLPDPQLEEIVIEPED